MVVVLLFLQVVPTFASNEEPDIVSRAAVVIDSKTKEVLYEKNMEEIRTPASLTKMLTAILVVENLDLKKEIVAPKEAIGIKGNNMNLKKGEKLTVEELLNAMLIYSANDAAIALGVEVAGSLENFYQLMNEKARVIGCKNSNFISANGLTNNIKHHSTAYDMALIAAKSMEYKEIRKIVKKIDYTIEATNKSDERTFKTTNRLLYDKKHTYKLDGKNETLKYDLAIGVKTGLMNSSGHCLAAAAKKDGTEVISVVLGSSEDLARFEESKTLLMYAFDNFKTYEAIPKDEAVGKVKIKRGAKLSAEVFVNGGAYVTLPKTTENSVVTTEVVLKDDIEAPVKKGTVVGYVKIKDAGTLVDKVDVSIGESVKKGGPWTILGISNLMMIIIALVILALLVLLITMKTSKKRLRKKRELAAKRAREEKILELARQRAEKKKREWPY